MPATPSTVTLSEGAGSLRHRATDSSGPVYQAVEEGALKGPAIMPGGKKETYDLIAPILTAISAKVDGEPCCTYIGTDGAGHYVKNGPQRDRIR